MLSNRSRAQGWSNQQHPASYHSPNRFGYSQSGHPPNQSRFPNPNSNYYRPQQSPEQRFSYPTHNNYHPVANYQPQPRAYYQSHNGHPVMRDSDSAERRSYSNTSSAGYTRRESRTQGNVAAVDRMRKSSTVRRASMANKAAMQFDAFRFAVEFATAVDQSFKDLHRPQTLMELSEAYQQFVEREKSGIPKASVPSFANAVKCLEEMNYVRSGGTLDELVYGRNYMFPGEGEVLAEGGVKRAAEQTFPPDCQFFVMKAPCMSDLRSSMKHKKWSAKSKTRFALNQAFSESSMVILIFSVNKSGAFQGFARMTSPIPPRRSSSWDNQEEDDLPIPDGALPFSVEWLTMQPVQYQATDHLANPWNSGLPLRRCREGEELPHNIGRELCGGWNGLADSEDGHKRRVSFGAGSANSTEERESSEPRNARRKSAAGSERSSMSSGNAATVRDKTDQKISAAVSDSGIDGAEGVQRSSHRRRRSSLPPVGSLAGQLQVGPVRCSPNLVIRRLDWSDVSSNPDMTYDVQEHSMSFEPLMPYDNTPKKPFTVTVESVDNSAATTRAADSRMSRRRSSVAALSEMRRRSAANIRQEVKRRSLAAPTIVEEHRSIVSPQGSAGTVPYTQPQEPIDLGDGNGELPFPAGLMSGICVSWNPLQGYGFVRPLPSLILAGEERDVFIHAKNIRLPSGKRKLHARIFVEFRPNYVKHKDSLYATDLMPLDEEFTGEL
eukprot:7561_1